MWRPAVVTTPPSGGSAVSIADARLQVRVGADETDNVTTLTSKLAAAISHVEAYTGTALNARTVTVRCDSFDDFVHLPFGPVTGITSISYRDQAGTTQLLASDRYELRSDGLEAAIAPSFNTSWPSIAAGSLITVVAAVGYATVPDAVRDAVLLITGQMFDKRENDAAPDWSTVDLLLVNHRI